MAKFVLDTAKRKADKPAMPPKKKVVAKKAPVKKKILHEPPVPKVVVKMVQGELPNEFLEELNRELADGWEVINIFVKHYDYAAAIKKLI